MAKKQALTGELLKSLKTDDVSSKDVLKHALAGIGGAEGLGQRIAELTGPDSTASDGIKVQTMNLLTRLMDVAEKERKAEQEYSQLTDADVEAVLDESLARAVKKR